MRNDIFITLITIITELHRLHYCNGCNFVICVILPQGKTDFELPPESHTHKNFTLER